MLKLTSALLLSIPLSQALEVTLFARSLDGEHTQSLGTLDYERETGVLAVTSSAAAAEVPLGNSAYCIGTHSSDSSLEHSCFSLLELEWPLHYRLEVSGDKFSLVHDPTVDGLSGAVVEAGEAPLGSAIPLRKTTKTYADKRKDSEDGAEQFGAGSATEGASEEEEPEGGPLGYLKNNWKQLLVGLVIYNVVTGLIKPGEEARGEKKE